MAYLFVTQCDEKEEARDGMLGRGGETSDEIDQGTRSGKKTELGRRREEDANHTEEGKANP
ncbi:hypothetical protein HJFPF1_06879 [Paramyrothecium foliicola]|nr:hypothetical protein HJFPF1_06879 [Paramyrothecium foliicola]